MFLTLLLVITKLYVKSEFCCISNTYQQKSPNLNNSGKSRDDWISIELFGGGFEEVGGVFWVIQFMSDNAALFLF